MNQDEQRALAIECGAVMTKITKNIYFSEDLLAAYTAAVEAKERDRCIAKCTDVRNIYIDQDRPVNETALLCAATSDCENAIRSLINE